MAAQGPPSPLPGRHAGPNSAHSRGFVGRDDEKYTLKQFLQTPRQGSTGQRRLVIAGKAGQGKTALCTEVVEELQDGFSGVFRIDVSTPQAAQKDFANLIGTSRSTATDISAALQYLANKKDDWILILENANDVDFTYGEYFPPCDHGFIIIVSREQSVARFGTTEILLLGPMSIADSVLLLLQNVDWSVPHESRKSAERAASLLGNHPLSLILAGAYIANRRCSFASYASDLEMQKSEMQSNQANPKSPWTSAYAACELSAKTLVSFVDGSAALDLLSRLSLIPRNPVSIETASSTWWKQVPSSVNELRPPRRERNAVTPPPAGTTSFEAALNRLLSFSFVSIASDRISIHPIIRAWAQDRNPLPQHTPPPSRSDSSRSASPYHHHYSMYAPTTNLELYPYGAHFEQTHRSGSMPDDRYCLPQPRGDAATAMHFTTTPPSPRSREPSPFDRRRDSAYGPFATGEPYATNSDTEEEAPRRRSTTTIRRYFYAAASPVRSPGTAREVEYYHEREDERPDLFTSDEESAGEEERYRKSRYLRVDDVPSSRRSSGSRRRGDEEGGREHGRRRRRTTRSRHGSRESHSSDRRSEEEGNHRGREARETKLEVRGSVGFGRWKYQAMFAASSGGRTG